LLGFHFILRCSCRVSRGGLRASDCRACEAARGRKMRTRVARCSALYARWSES
jgi:hypothetical protein